MSDLTHLDMLCAVIGTTHNLEEMRPTIETLSKHANAAQDKAEQVTEGYVDTINALTHKADRLQDEADRARARAAQVEAEVAELQYRLSQASATAWPERAGALACDPTVPRAVADGIIKALVIGGEKIQAIKSYRDLTGASLKESMAVINGIADDLIPF